MIETNRVEFKAKLTDDLEKEIVAFLNYRDGGVLYIGVDNNGKPVKLDNLDTMQLKIKDRLKNNIAPSSLGLFDVVIEELDSFKIIKIIIASGSEKPYYIKKRGMSEKGCFIRVGSASEPMSVRMIEDLFAKRARNSLGKIVSPQQELTFAQLKIFYEAKSLILNDNFAKNLELLNSDGSYNYVAYLMADKNNISIKVAKYAGVNRVELIESNEIPPKFEIFDDRLEITSAGSLPEGMDKDEFFEGVSNPKNKEIMRIYKDLDMVEQLGSGVPRILRTYSKDSFIFMNNFTRMIFEKSSGSIGGQIGGQISGQISLTDRQKDIIDLIKRDDKISRKSISQKLDINQSAVLKHLNTLKQKNAIERVGGTRGYWRILF